MVGEIVCIVNRAPWPLSVIKDGRTWVLKPGDNYINGDLVRFARQQHPIPGSQDPYNPHVVQFLVGVKGTNDPIDALPAEILEYLPKERIDRTKMPAKQQNVVERQVPFPRGRQAAMENPAGGMSFVPEGARGGD
jgi:hypothetical protein